MTKKKPTKREETLKALTDWGFEIKEEKGRFFPYFNGMWYDSIGGVMGYKTKKGAENGIIRWYEKPA